MTGIPTTGAGDAGDAVLPHETRSSGLSYVTLGLLCAAPYLAMLLSSLKTQTLRDRVIFAVTTVLVTMLFAASAATWRRFFLLMFPFWIIASAYATYAVLVGHVPGIAVALLLSGASWEEISGLFGLWQQKWLMLPIAGLLALYLILALWLPVRPIFSRAILLRVRVLLLLVVPVAAYAAQRSADLLASAGLNPMIGSVAFFSVEVPRAHAALHGALVVKTPYHAQRAGTAEEVHILIIGESARRASWSAYGYSRATTPYLERLEKSGQAIFLRDAMSDANLTILAVPIILTGLTPRQMASDPQIHGSLLDLAKEGGYTTSWLVNQDVGVSTLLGIAADHLDYPPDLQEGLFGRHALDEALLPAFRREIARSGHARFIGMHVMGSHWEYYLRYPKSFQRFGSPQRLAMLSSANTDRSMSADLADAYDNTVLYTDYGEASPYLDGGAVGHGAAHYVAAEFEIPAFIWVNAAYRAAHPDKVAALQANAAKEIRSHDVFYTVADLMEITWPGTAPQKSFASERFVPDSTREHLMRGILGKRPD
jgi:glucan phosphoethanolaminetransferase (alkaline phosphatase superfamily)